MGLFAKAGVFAIDTSTGNQAITGVGFQPKIVFFLPTNATVDGVSAHAHWGFGVGISSSDRRCMTVTDEDAQGTTDTARETHTSHCIIHNVSGSTTPEYEADFVSLDADGFTINVTTAPGTGKRVGYLALGGTDLTNVATGDFKGDNAVGDQAIAGVGFQPDALIFFTIAHPTAAETSGNDFPGSIGWALSPTKRGYSAAACKHNQATSNTARQQDTDACIFVPSGTGSQLGLADLASMDADGFTVDWSDAIDSYIHYIALKGGQYDIGSITSQVAPGNFSDTSMAFTGAAMILMSFCNAASGAKVGHAEISLGIATSSSDRFVAGCVSEDNQAASDCDSFQDDGLVYKNYDHAQNVEGAVDFVSFNSDGFTLDQTDADPAGNQLLWLVIGAEAVARIPRHPAAYNTLAIY